MDILEYTLLLTCVQDAVRLLTTIVGDDGLDPSPPSALMFPQRSIPSALTELEFGLLIALPSSGSNNSVYSVKNIFICELQQGLGIKNQKS